MSFPTIDSEVKALHAVAQSGIGMGLNATGVYNAYYCSQTQAMTMDRVANKFFPPFNLYVILYGVTSEAQMEYEEKVFREIMAEHKATFLTPEHKGDVLYALAPWNLDCIRHVTGFRMNRYFYGGSIVPGGCSRTPPIRQRKSGRAPLTPSAKPSLPTGEASMTRRFSTPSNGEADTGCRRLMCIPIRLIPETAEQGAGSDRCRGH